MDQGKLEFAIESCHQTDGATAVAPTRAAALQRLDEFVAGAATDYARERNFDRGAGRHYAVSRLSACIRHRLITEQEVVAAITARHGATGAAKFVQEVFWRSYWKGWLELRPRVWSDFQRAVVQRFADIDGDVLDEQFEVACEGRTGIDAFDAWVAELRDTGYLHNHARMWFASIWTHTLGLPWELGADFFMRHLHDGDPASNTLSWRWVVGLQTPGKTYLAKRDNIARYTEGRFEPQGLASVASLANAQVAPASRPLATLAPPPPGPAALLLTEEDLHAESLPLADQSIVAVASAHAAHDRSPLGVAGGVIDYTRRAQADALARAGRHFACAGEALADLSLPAVLGFAQRHRVKTVITPYAPVGPAHDRLRALEHLLATSGITLARVRRVWDELTWPHAQRGFFSFAERIPALLADPRVG
jgi:deoxyribodipyrimidine photo-lyase